MARHDGIIELSGKVGNIVFSNRNGKRQAKAKATKPMNQTAATKKSSTDFREATKVGARIRNAFMPLIKKYSDPTLTYRFTSQILAVLKTIPSALVGQKKIGQGDISILRDFQFNAEARLGSLLHQQPVVTLLPSGLKMAIPAIAINQLFANLPTAHAAVLQLRVYSLNLDGDNDEVVPINNLIIPFAQERFRGAKLEVPLNFTGQQVVLVALGIHYLKDEHMMGDKTKRAAAIIFAVRLSNGSEVIFIPEQKEPEPQTKEESGLNWEVD